MSRLFLLSLCLIACDVEAQEPTPPVDVPPETVQNQYPLKRVAPTYPPLARQARIQGTVLLRIVISKSGDVTELSLISGHPLLAPAVIEAVREWKYRPCLRDGEAIEVETVVLVKFALDG